MAEEHDFPVYLLHAPMYAGLVQSEAFRSYFNEVSAHLRAFAAGSAKVHYVPDVITFNEEMMQNVDHVIRPAAERYTRAVFSRIVEDFWWRSEHSGEPAPGEGQKPRTLPHER